MLGVVKESVRQVSLAYHGAGHDGRNALLRAGQPQDVAGDDPFPLVALAVRFPALARLRVVEQHKVRPQHLAGFRVLPLAADRAGQPVSLQDGAVAGVRLAGRRVEHLGEYQRGLAPLNAAAFAVGPQLEPRLNCLAVRLARVLCNVRVVLMQAVALGDLLPAELDKDLSHLPGGRDDDDVFPPAGQQDVEAYPFQDGRFALPARHGKGEQAAVTDSRLNLGEHAQMVTAPRPVERLAAVVAHPVGKAGFEVVAEDPHLF